MGETTSEAGGGPAVWGNGTGGVVYRTTDGGEIWQEIWDSGMPGSLARYLWIDPDDTQVLYVSTGIFDRGALGEGDSSSDPFGGIGILKSTDGGETWRVLDEANGLRLLYLGSLFMHPTNPEILLAAAGHTTERIAPYLELLLSRNEISPFGIYRTEDGGEQWAQVIAPPPSRIGEVFSAVEICPSDPQIAYASSDQAVYRSQDAGVTWTMMTEAGAEWGPAGIVPGVPIDMQCDPEDPDRLFVNNYGGGNFLSEDGGRTWVNASQGYSGAQMRQVAVDPADVARVFAVGRSGIWVSVDAGTTWNGRMYSTEGFEPSAEWTAVALDPADSDHVLAAGLPNMSLLESEDGGRSWTVRWSPADVSGSLDRPLAAGNAIRGPGFVNFIFAPSDPDVVLAALGDVGCALLHEPCPDSNYGLLMSQNGGESWSDIAAALPAEGCIVDAAINPVDASDIFLATWAGLLHSTDGGSTWSVEAGVREEVPVRAVAFDPQDPQHVVAALEGLGAVVTFDGGETWSTAFVGLEPNGSLHDIVFDPTDQDIVYVSDHSSGVYRSQDGGQTWTKINNGLSFRAATGLGISSDGLHLYLATDGGGVFRLDLNGQSPAAAITEPAASPVPLSPTPRPQPPAEGPTTTGLSTGGIVLGVLLGGTILLALVLAFLRRRHRPERP
jgi:photosystem II stability/assembly factor-like uncharacterized protein